jgi:hypothetical protein
MGGKKWFNHRMTTVRKIISDRHWQQLEPLVAQAKHSRAGAPPALSRNNAVAKGVTVCE